MANLKGIKGGKDNFTKKDLIDLVANDAGLTKKDTKTVIDSLFNVIPEITKSGGYITIAGFGTFKETKTKARTMHLSAKQKRMLKTTSSTKHVPAKRTLRFSQSKNY